MTPVASPAWPPGEPAWLARWFGSRPPAWVLPLFAFATALVFRLLGLGGGSMWLDEIMETLFANGSLRQLAHALIFDRAMPPFEPLVTWLLLQLDWSELSRRILNTVFGAAAIAVFARWVERRFGFATAATAALFLASSPLYVRYAHELRPYALALLLFAWSIDAADRWFAKGANGSPGNAAGVDTGGFRSWPWELVLAAALATCTHYFAFVLWVVVAAAFLEGRVAGQIETPLRPRHLAAVALSLTPLALWGAVLLWRGGPSQPIPPTEWTWATIETRFEMLLLRGVPGQPIVPGAPLLFATLAVIGFWVLSRRRGGLTVHAGLVAGTLLVEIALPLAGRFSHFRYDQFGVLFLHVAMAAAVVAFGRLLARYNRLSGFTSAALLAAAVVASHVTGLVAYAQHGRPDWPAMARAIRTLDGDEARVAVSVPWAQISIGYYLGRYTRWPEEPRGIALLMNERAKLEEEMSRPDGRTCRLVLIAGWPRERGLLDGYHPNPPVLRHVESDETELYRFAVAGTAKEDCAPQHLPSLVHSPGYGRLLPFSH